MLWANSNREQPPSKGVTIQKLHSYYRKAGGSMATQRQIEQAAEKARKAKVDAYKKAIKNMEEDDKLFYENQLKRQQISEEEFAAACKARSERYAQHSRDVLSVAYMTEEEKYDLSRYYMQKSEEALTEHIKRVTELEKEKAKEALKARRAASEESMENSVSYISDRNYSDDWKDVGDDPRDAFKRVQQRLESSVADGTITQEEYYEKLSDFGTQMYEDRIDNSNRWLRHESEMNRLSTEEYIAGLYRMQTYTQQYYDAGMITQRQYYDGMQSLEERLFAKKQELHREILAQAEEEKASVDNIARARIDALEAEYSARLSDIDKENRDEELAELRAQEKIYASAQTKEGKDRLADIRDKIDNINDEEKREKLKKSLAEDKESVLSAAERKKASIDKNASRKALDIGLYYDGDDGYRMISSAKSTFGSVLKEQNSFAEKSKEGISAYNSELNTLMTDSTNTLAGNILTSFSAFAAGVEAIKKQIFSDVEAVNSLDFSRFGTSKSPIKTSITYNDYGDKNISGINGATDYFSNLGNLLAKGGRF